MFIVEVAIPLGCDHSERVKTTAGRSTRRGGAVPGTTPDGGACVIMVEVLLGGDTDGVIMEEVL